MAVPCGSILGRLLAERELALVRHREHLEELVETRTKEFVAARQAAETANHAKSTFLSSMSHELRTPMNAILGFAQLSAADPSLPLVHRERLSTILRAGFSLLDLVDEILDLAKIEAGKIAPQPATFDLHDPGR